MTGRLENKVAIVTGGAMGLGAADSTLFNGNAVQLVYVDGTIGFLEI